jgi:hypothetical protein
LVVGTAREGVAFEAGFGGRRPLDLVRGVPHALLGLRVLALQLIRPLVHLAAVAFHLAGDVVVQPIHVGARLLPDPVGAWVGRILPVLLLAQLHPVLGEVVDDVVAVQLLVRVERREPGGVQLGRLHALLLQNVLPLLDRALLHLGALGLLQRLAEEAQLVEGTTCDLKGAGHQGFLL